ncbi:MAG: ribonuclease HII [Alphaproteobacteria bacterium]
MGGATKRRGGGKAGATRRERVRMLFTERALWEAGVELVAGVDEVGMGPLAGPVVAAAVVLPRGVDLDGIRDSKLLTAKRRGELEAEIRGAALGIGIGVVEHEEVDRLNVYQAGLEAMARAIAGLPVVPEHLLVDARRVPGCEIRQTCVAGGDRKVYSIAVASIVAKVHRDRVMAEMDDRYPGYGFARHAGYATAAHLRALRDLGPCAIHRRSFAPVRAALGLPDVPATGEGVTS